ncbi:hypothetical protein AD006_30420 (plasmid) [Pseudonocardia sp. EC080610-09]|uniref:integration host factor, actinobacterial type n=1 Tax=unclassified Pseudonocardia TaxID=2619320 RepID=UPI0007064939|nr:MULTISPECIES: integration host factor, actinobacterial type [unclassified Pseudonocardia]ALL79536.1 hypothetical protein AD006_30420 [Pseudonocardia sp. EC080610-09]ALL85511.1 hypothetical protein AD017_30830 [Pseudonocardia sp. EC080619-01]
MALPHLAANERAAALDKALAARRERAAVKARLRRSETSVEDVLNQAQTNDALQQIKVVELLLALPNFGNHRATALMQRLRIAPNRRIRGLGRRQREALRIEYPRP